METHIPEEHFIHNDSMAIMGSLHVQRDLVATDHRAVHWVPTNIGIRGNELTDSLAEHKRKQPLVVLITWPCSEHLE